MDVTFKNNRLFNPGPAFGAGGGRSNRAAYKAAVAQTEAMLKMVDALNADDTRALAHSLDDVSVTEETSVKFSIVETTDSLGEDVDERKVARDVGKALGVDLTDEQEDTVADILHDEIVRVMRQEISKTLESLFKEDKRLTLRDGYIDVSLPINTLLSLAVTGLEESVKKANAELRELERAALAEFRAENERNRGAVAAPPAPVPPPPAPTKPARAPRKAKKAMPAPAANKGDLSDDDLADLEAGLGL